MTANKKIKWHQYWHNMLRRANQSIGLPAYKWLFVYQEPSARIDKLVRHLALNFVKRSVDTEAL